MVTATGVFILYQTLTLWTQLSYINLASNIAVNSDFNVILRLTTTKQLSLLNFLLK